MTVRFIYCRLLLPVFLILSAVPVCFPNTYTKNRMLSVIQTEHFDFIYPEESAETARLLSGCAEALYQKACALLETDRYLHIPVVITPDSDMLNGYYTCIPYNRIVVCDTAPESGSLTAYREIIVSVFYHELVHAVSLNMKSPALRAVSSVIGEVVNPALELYLPTSFIEGVTVSFESMGGEGRLNDPYSLHILQQAKREGVFPSWQQASGVRDVYPIGALPYIFGGAFSAWLQQRYGMSQYALYWKECGKVQFFKLAAGIFKKVYGIPLADAWNEFRDSISLEYTEDPAAQSGFRRIEPRGLYKSLTASPAGMAWIDAVSGRIRWLPRRENARVSTLADSGGGDSRLAFSSDGLYLAVSRTQMQQTVGKNEIRVFDMNKRRFFSRVPGLRDSCILTLSDGSRYLAGIAGRSQVSEIRLYRLEDSAGRHPEPCAVQPFAAGTIPFSLCDAGDGSLLYLEKRIGKWYLCKWNPFDGSRYAWSFENGTPSNLQAVPDIRLSDVSAGDNRLMNHADAEPRDAGSFVRFTCEWHPALSAPDTAVGHASPVPVTRFMNITLDMQGTVPYCSFAEQQTPFSGGVFFPVADGTGADGNLVFVSRHYDYDEVVSVPLQEAGCGNSVLQALIAENAAPDTLQQWYSSIAPDILVYPETSITQKSTIVPDLTAQSENSMVSDISIQPDSSPEQSAPMQPDEQPAVTDIPGSRRFYPLAGMKKGALLPLPISSVVAIPTQLTSFKPGLSYFTADPTEKWMLLAETGFDVMYKSTGVLCFLSRSGLYTMQSIQLALDITTDNDKVFEGWHTLSATFPVFSNRSVLKLKNSFFYCAADIPADSAQTKVKDGRRITDIASVSFSTVRKTGLGAYESFKFSAEFSEVLDLNQMSRQRKYLEIHPGVALTAEFPCLLPFENPPEQTVNLPFFLSLSLFPEETTETEKNICMKMEGGVVLYSHEIQNALWILYADRLSFSASYRSQLIPHSGRIYYRDLSGTLRSISGMEYCQSAVLKAYIECSAIMGYLTGLSLKVGLEAEYRFYGADNDRFRYSIGVIYDNLLP